MARTQTRSESINLRITRSQKTLIDRAAELREKSRSAFMLEAACREAETLLLDQHHFALPEGAFKRFMAVLDEPPRENVRLRQMLASKAPWEP